MIDIVKPGILLAAFATVTTALLLLVDSATEARIADNEREMLLYQLNQIIDESKYNNQLQQDTTSVTDQKRLGSKAPVTVYRARMNKKPVAAVIATVAPDGYNGKIHLLVGIDTNGTITNVRVTKHKETPGLGDAIEDKRSDWILDFAGKSLTNPLSPKWKVNKDGGDFDSLTGATITPRAVVKAVHNTLLYYNDEQAALFAKTLNEG